MRLAYHTGDVIDTVTDRSNRRIEPLLGNIEPVLVQCPGFRCMAIRGKDGKWRDYFHNDELPAEVELVRFEELSSL